MFLDETGSTTNLLRRYGRAPRGARGHDHAPGGRWQTSTFLAALRGTGLTAPGVFDGAIDGESFRAYIDQILVPTLHPGDIVIADTTSGPTRSPASSGPSRPPGPPSSTCHPTARTSIPSSSASRSSRPSFAPLAVAAPRRSGRSSASAWRTSALTHAATIFGTAGTRPHTVMKSALELAVLEEGRARALHESGVESAEALDRALTSMRVAQATLAVRHEELALLEEGTRKEEIDAIRAEVAEAEAPLALAEQGYREEDIEKARAAVAAAESTLAAIDRRLEELVIRAPVAGIVEAITLRPCDLVGANAPALSLLDPSRLWVRAYVPEGRLVLAIGQEVSLRVDPFPDETFLGRLSFIAREAEFTPGNVQTPEERSKQVFRIKVDLVDGLDRLRSGMSADVILDDLDGASR